MLASLADEDADTRAAALVHRWASLERGQVIRRVIGPASVQSAVKVALRRPAGLFDPSPLTRSLGEWVDFDRAHRNVSRGHVESVCTVATSIERGGAVAFVDSRGPVPAARPGADVAYVAAPLSIDHVRASAAIPFVFPPVRVREPAAAAGHYIDGGTRLNSPLKPALPLGADRVVVIGFAPFGRGPAPPRRHFDAPTRVSYEETECEVTAVEEWRSLGRR